MNSVVYRQHFMATGGEMSNGLHNDVLNGKNCLKRFLFDQNFALQGLYFDQNFEKCTLVVGHFILNQIFKNVEKGQQSQRGARRSVGATVSFHSSSDVCMK